MGMNARRRPSQARGLLTRLAALVVFGLPVCSGLLLPPTSSAQTVSGIGARPCETFIIAGEQASNDALDAIINWSQGFVSGFNWSNVRQADVRLDHAAIALALGDYCAHHPREPIYRGLQAIIARNAR